jgi:predicted metal-dependent TIM-barrel fold hydrolase
MPFNKIDIIHTLYRNMRDLDILHHCGVGHIISPTWLPLEPSSGAFLRDIYNWQTRIEVDRGAACGIKIHPALGIPPSGAITKNEIVEEALFHLESFLKTGKACAIGEIGLGVGAKHEYIVFRHQLELANRYNLPVIIKAPDRDNIALMPIILNEVKKSKVPGILINNCEKTHIPYIIAEPFSWIKAGITVGSRFLSREQALDAYKATGMEERVCLNSSMSIQDRNLYAQIEVIEYFEREKLGRILNKITYDNYISLFPAIGKQAASDGME